MDHQPIEDTEFHSLTCPGLELAASVPVDSMIWAVWRLSPFQFLVTYMSRVAFVPEISSQTDLDETVARCAWYLYSYREQIEAIDICSAPGLYPTGQISAILNPGIAERLQDILPKIHITHHGGRGLVSWLDGLQSVDVLFRWDLSKSASGNIEDWSGYRALKSKGRVIEVDPVTTQMEGSFYLWAGLNLFSDKDALAAENKKKFRTFATSLGDVEKAYVFGTGPTLSEFAAKHDFSDGVCIAANSMVKNLDLLDRLKPVAIVAADPIFHAGCSSYAAAFQKDLAVAMERYNAWFITSLRDLNITLSYLPKHLHDRVIGVPFKPGDSYNTKLLEQFHVNPLPNILTLLLLPVAAAISKKIEVLGCDGRPATENSYFWSHDKAVQFNDEMDAIKKVHPGFFSIDYQDYYDTHCRDLERALLALESDGHIVESQTPSFIPALQARHASNLGPDTDPHRLKLRTANSKAVAKMAEAKTLVVSVDPDAVDFNGHYMAYNKRLQEECVAQGHQFGVLGRRDLDDSCVPADMPVFKSLTVHSWSMSVQGTGKRARFTDTFRSEVRHFLDSLPDNPDQDVCMYMYCGSLEHAYALVAEIGDRKNYHLNINLFWQSFVSMTDIPYLNRWRPHIMRFASNPRLTLTVPTKTVAEEVERRFGLRVKIAPHPSTTFSDAEARALGETKGHVLGQSTKILFPASPRPDKGFGLTVEVAEQDAGSDSVELVVRTRLGADAKDEQVQLVDRLKKTTATCVDSDLDDDQFKAFLESGDVVVCPYTKEAFAARTSGIVIDALLLGRPVVALEETWLGDLVSQTGIGSVAAPDARSIRSAIDAVIDNYKKHQASIAIARLEYLEKNSWHALVSFIVAPVEKTSAKQLRPVAELKAERDNLIKKLPPNIRSPIFMPTDRILLEQQVDGLKGVVELHEGGLDALYRPKLRALRDARKKKRCFIIGNGPSLKSTDLSLLKKEITFATNGFFLHMPELTWMPTFYVVEDHLVAEDRAHEVNMLRGMTKLFPANLRYILTPDDDTVYFDHRPRKSAPDGFDFSFDADKHTYAGGTVTFTCMELAAFFGFEEIYLIGVDADYAIPKDAVLMGDGRVKEIDMQSDDVNHFHPDYFGKGKRWHEPNVHVMLRAYAEARRECEKRGIAIRNATVGGKLEVFPRQDFATLFPESLPRVLVIDLTSMSDGTATGELKGTLFANWAPDRLMQIFLKGGKELGTLLNGQTTVFEDNSAQNRRAIEGAAAEFNPDLIIYRPTAGADVLHGLAKKIINDLDRPLALWIMDDWLASMKASGGAKADELENDWRNLVSRSSLRLSISPEMSTTMKARYGADFHHIANGVDLEEWPVIDKVNKSKVFRIRYAGSLQENMTLRSVLKVAEAVNALAERGFSVSFEILTRKAWINIVKPKIRHLKNVDLFEAGLPREDYMLWLSEADAVVIAYNFDSASKKYIGDSIANKLPECLASGVPLIAFGPADVATISRVKALDCALCITDDDPQVLQAEIEKLAGSEEKCRELAESARDAASEHFNIYRTRSEFQTLLSNMTKPGSEALPRSAHAHVDETEVVGQLLSNRKGGQHIMLDVGAHFGTSAAYFHTLGWTIHCFEPDAENRKNLVARYGNAANVSIDTRAVSDVAGKILPFYTSPESTGISGLNKFRDTHQVSVEVKTTTVAEYVRDKKISRVDFLKIDVEGFDFSVLKGVPWDTLKPDVIECEYEDSKTIKLGHKWRDIADYLKERGYVVYVSEWHPIIRYGVAHDWKTVVPYDQASDVVEDSWGNLLAFRVDPGYEAVRQAFRALTKNRSVASPKPPVSKAAVSAPVADSAAARPFYAELGEWIAAHSPRAFAGLQFARRVVAGMLRRKWMVPVLLSLVAAVGVTFIPQAGLGAWRPWMLGGAAFAIAMLSTVYLALRVYQYINVLSEENRSLRKSIEYTRKDVERVKAESKLLSTKAEKVLSGLHETEKKQAAVQASTQKYVQEILISTKKDLELAKAVTKKDIKAIQSDIVSDIGKKTSEIQKALEETVSTLKEQTGQQAENTEQAITMRLDTALSEVNNVVDQIRQRIAAGERQIGEIKYPDAPRTIVLFGHHKCASRYFRDEIFTRVAEMTDSRVRRYKIEFPPFHHTRMDELDLCNIDFNDLGVDGRDVLLLANATMRSFEKIRRSTEDWRGVRFIRDPRQVFISNYFHHKGNHATEYQGWVWDQLVKDKPILRDLSEEEGLLHELDSISKGVIEEQILAPLDDPRILTFKLENFEADPKGHLKKIADFLEIADIAGLRLSKLGQNLDAGTWQQHFTSRLRDIFKERYGQALIDLGYAEDMDW